MSVLCPLKRTSGKSVFENQKCILKCFWTELILFGLNDSLTCPEEFLSTSTRKSWRAKMDVNNAGFEVFIKINYANVLWLWDAVSVSHMFICLQQPDKILMLPAGFLFLELLQKNNFGWKQQRWMLRHLISLKISTHTHNMIQANRTALLTGKACWWRSISAPRAQMKPSVHVSVTSTSPHWQGHSEENNESTCVCGLMDTHTHTHTVFW